jgi:hypothetical protein
MLGHGSVSFAGGFLLVMTIAILLTSAHDILSKRYERQQPERPDELSAAISTKQLPAPSHETHETSVTESTTRELKVKVRRET